MFNFLKQHLRGMVLTALSLAPTLLIADHHDGGGRSRGNVSWSAASRQRYSYDDKVRNRRSDYNSDDHRYSYKGRDYDRRYYGRDDGHRRNYYYNNYYYAPTPYYGGYAYPSYYYSYPYYDASPYDGYYTYPSYDTGPNVGLYFQVGN